MNSLNMVLPRCKSFRIFLHLQCWGPHGPLHGSIRVKKMCPSKLSPFHMTGCAHELSPFDYHSVRYVLVSVKIFSTTIVTSLNTYMVVSRIQMQNYLNYLRIFTESINVTLTFTNLLSFQTQNFLRKGWFD